MALPETDLHRIQLWARVPEHLWTELKGEADVSDRYVDIVEVRPNWTGEGDPIRFPIARRATPRPPASGRSTGMIGT